MNFSNKRMPEKAKLIAISFAIILSTLISGSAFAQLTGTKTIPGTYATLALAVADLNTQGVGAGGVTFDIAAGYTETLTSVLSITATGTLANPIVFQKSGVGANPLITAPAGGTALPTSTTAFDGIIRCIGSDWITFNGINLSENSSNSGTALMEYGFGFFKSSSINGCNRNTIINCTISLSKNNISTASANVSSVLEFPFGSCGIWFANTVFNAPTVALTVTNTTGTNSNNKIYSDTIQNCDLGIMMKGYADVVGPYSFYDQSNDIGGNSASTGNWIINFGGGIPNNQSQPAFGIEIGNGNAVNISYNTIRSSNAPQVHFGDVKGIFAVSPNAALTTVNNNTISVRTGTVNFQQANFSMEIQSGSILASSVLNVLNNTITNSQMDSGLSSGSTAATVGIRIASCSPKTVNITANLIFGDTVYNCGQFSGILYSGSNLNADVNITNNQVYNIYKLAGNPSSGAGTLVGISSTPGRLNISGNSIHDLRIDSVGTIFTPSMTGTINGILLTSQANTIISSITNNQVYNLFMTGISTNTTGMNITGLNNSGNTGTQVANFTISGNSFSNFSAINPTVGAGGTIRGMELSCGFNLKAFNNKINDLTGNGNGFIVKGISILAAVNLDLYNNYIGNLFAPNATVAAAPAEQVIGISDESATSGQNRNIYYNTVYISGTSSGTNFGSSAMKSNVNPNTTLRNNIFDNNTAPKGFGLAVAHRRSGVGITTFMNPSNNNIYFAGTPAATNLIYYDGTNSDQTIGAYKTRVFGRENASAVELVSFLSTVGSNPNFLHVNGAIGSAAESGGANIAGITNDFDGDIRQGNLGYAGTGSAPDIGADEFGGTISDVTAPAIAAGTILNSCNNGDRTIIGVIITDATGVPITGSLVPRIYYKKNVGGTYFSRPGVLNSGTGSNGSWSFTIVAADMGGLTTTDSVGYYFIAQDVVGTPNISSVPFGAVATDVNTVSTHPTSISYLKILTALNGTYLVGSTHAAPFDKIANAVNLYNTACLTGSVVFSLDDANYINEPLAGITINSNPYASATNTLTIKPASGNVSIAGTFTNYAIGINAADYIIIEGSASPVSNSVCPLVQSSRNLTITNNSTAVSSNSVIYMCSNGFDGATNNIVRNCNIVGGNNSQANAGIGMGLGPVATGLGTATSSLGYDNSNNIIENNNISKVQHGIVSQGFSYAIKNQNNIYRLNQMTASTPLCVGRIGILVGFENNDLIIGNTIKNITGAASGATVIAISAGNTNNISATGTSSNEVTNSEISYNIIDSIQSFATAASQNVVGISIGSSPSNYMSSGTNLIANNMISRITCNGNGGGGTNNTNITAGIFIGNQIGSTTKIYHNTVNLNATKFTGGTSTSPNVALYILGSGVIPACEVKNNILVSTGSNGLGSNYAMGIQIPELKGDYANLISDNNDFYVSPGGGAYNAIGVIGSGTNSPINPGYINYPTLAGWQAETGRDANSKNVLPLFISTGNPHLVNNAAANASLNGTASVTTITSDIDCESRTGAGSPDMGADEFTGPSIDIAFDALKPTANTTCHSAAESIIVTVRNTGVNTINLATDSIFVTTNVTGTITAAATGFAGTGTLSPNATVDITLTPAINTTVAGSYTFNTTLTALAGEVITSNNSNTTTFSIANTPLTVTTSVVNDSICLGLSTPASALAAGGISPYSYAWDNGGGTGSAVTLSPGIQTIYTVTATDACGNTATATAFVDVFTAGVQSVSGNSRCGVGTVSLSAVPNPGSSLIWYNSPAGQTVAGSGNSYTTPSISTTTSFYVSAKTGTGSFTTGLKDLALSNGGPFTFPVIAQASLTSGNISPMGITVTKPGAITAATVYPSAAGAGDTAKIIICLRLRGSRVNIATAGPFSFTQSQVGNPVRLTFNIPVNTPGDYQLIYDSVPVNTTGFTKKIGLGIYSFNYTGGGFPFYTSDSSFALIGGTSSSTSTSYSTSSYNNFFNVEYTTYCESARVPVLATVNTPAVLTIPATRNLCLGDTMAISVSSTISDYDTYVWTPITNLYTDAGCTTPYVLNASASTVYVRGPVAGSQVYTCTATNTTSGCVNLATSTVTTQPAVTSVLSNTYGLCGGGYANLTAFPSTGYGAGAIQWQSSLNNSLWNTIPGNSTAITSPAITASTYFRINILNSNNTVCSQQNVGLVSVYAAYVSSVTPDTVCGVGSDTLSATVSSGATAAWYSSLTSTVPLATGLTYATPLIANTTTYYVAAQEGNSTNSVGLPSTTGYGTTFTSTVNTLWLTIVKPVLISTITMYPQTAGTFQINLMTRAAFNSVVVQSSTPIIISAGQVGTAVVVPVNMTIGTPGAYQLAFSALSFTAVSYNGTGNGFPFVSDDGSIILQGTANNSTSTAAPSGSYGPFFNILYNRPCESARTAVVAVVNPTPPFTTNVIADTSCGLTPRMINVTSSIANYTNYTWLPITGLYTNPAGTIPYVSGSYATTVYANPLVTTAYTVTASDSIGGCVDTNKVIITPIFMNNVTTTANLTNVCGSGSVFVNIAGVVNSSLATYQWEISSDSLAWAPIPNAIGTSLLTPFLTSTRYFRCLVYCTGGLIGNSPALKIQVNNPQIVSTLNDTICGSGTMTLTAVPNAGSDLYWYTTPTGGLPVGFGNTYLTPSLTSTTTYYAEASTGNYNEPIGLPFNLTGSGTQPTAGRGLQFNANKQITINSCHVTTFDNQGGNMDIAVLNSAGVELMSTGNINFPANPDPLGKTSLVIPLNFTLPEGIGYRLVTKSGSGNFLTSGTQIYPLNSFSGAMAITAGVFSTANGNNAQYYFFYDLNITAACYSSRSPVVAAIRPVTPVTITASAMPVCPGSSVSLSATSAKDPFYTYVWMPGSLPGANVNVSPSLTTEYTLVATDISGGVSNGCQAITLKTVEINPPVPAFSMNSNNVITCGASPVTLGVNPNSPGNGSATIGTDLLNSNGFTDFPAAYGGFFESSKNQILILASELSAAGMTNGSEINSLAFNVGIVGSAGVLNNYTIKLAKTNLTALTGFAAASFTQVYGPVNYQPVAGLNTHVFTTPLIWDGISNIIVQTCFSNDPTGSGNFSTQNAAAYRTATANNSVAYANFNDLDVCPLSATAALSKNRPNMVLGYDKTITYSWSPATGLSATTGTSVIANPGVNKVYTVTASNLSGCTLTATTQVQVTAYPQARLQTGDTIVCSSSTGFYVKVKDIGAYAGGYPTGTTFEWVNYTPPTPGLDSLFVNLTDNYWVIVSLPGNLGGCSATSDTSFMDFSTSQSPLPYMQQDSVKCFGGSSGRAIAELISGNVGAYNYKWFNSAHVQVRNVTNNIPSDTLKNVPIGWYYCQVYNGIGSTQISCAVYDSIEVTQPDPLTSTAIVANATCYNTANGSIQVLPAGGTAPYTYLWNNGNTNQNRNVGKGTYYVTVTDANGCTTTAAYLITQPTKVLVNINKTNIRCGGSIASGIITVTPTGGVAPYTYLWNTGSSTATISNLIAGNYTVTVADNNGCLVVTTVNISQNPPLVVIMTLGPGSATANVSGGIAPYTYQWNTVPAQTTATATGLLNCHTYKVKISDSKGCTRVVSITIPCPKVADEIIVTEPAVTVFPNPSNGMITVNAVNFGTEVVTVKFYDGIGKVVFDSQIALQNNSANIDLSSFTPGIYMMNVINGDKLKTVRVVKQ